MEVIQVQPRLSAVLPAATASFLPSPRPSLTIRNRPIAISLSMLSLDVSEVPQDHSVTSFTSERFSEFVSARQVNTIRTIPPRQLTSAASKSGTLRPEAYKLKEQLSVFSSPVRQISSVEFQLLKSVVELRPISRLENADRISGRSAWKEFYRAGIRITRYFPPSVFREICQVISKHALFEALIMAVIVVNTVTTALVDGNDPSATSLLIDDVCLYVYTAEAGIKV